MLQVSPFNLPQDSTDNSNRKIIIHKIKEKLLFDIPANILAHTVKSGSISYVNTFDSTYLLYIHTYVYFSLARNQPDTASLSSSCHPLPLLFPIQFPPRNMHTVGLQVSHSHSLTRFPPGSRTHAHVIKCSL